MAEEQPRGDILMSWVFPEFTPHRRGRGWYLWFLVLVIGLLVYAIWSVAFSFAAVIVLATVVLVVRLRRPPLDVSFAIREEGIEVGTRFYVWAELSEFWIVYQPPQVKKLYIEFKSRTRPAMEIGIQEQNPLQIRQVLSENLLENTKREEEPLSDQWARMLKI